MYQYVKGSPVNATDPSGTYIESAWDAASLGISIVSLAHDVEDGQWGWAIVDGIGIIADTVALALPIIPGGVGAGVKALRAVGAGIDAANAVSRSVRVANAVSDAVKVADTVGNAIQTYDAYRRGDPLGIVLGTLGLGTRAVQGGFIAGRRADGWKQTRWYDENLRAVSPRKFFQEGPGRPAGLGRRILRSVYDRRRGFRQSGDFARRPLGRLLRALGSVDLDHVFISQARVRRVAARHPRFGELLRRVANSGFNLVPLPRHINRGRLNRRVLGLPLYRYGFTTAAATVTVGVGYGAYQIVADAAGELSELYEELLDE